MSTVTCLLALLSAPTGAADGVRKLLYVGNSFYYYNNSLHGHVNRMLLPGIPKSERSAFQSYSVTISGGQLKWHDIAAYLDAGIGDRAIDENNEDVMHVARAAALRCGVDDGLQPLPLRRGDSSGFPRAG
jgi:hypothetical protein